MATPNFWSNVSVSVQSAIATAITITGITKANPAVVSYSGVTDPANGDIITLSIQGMNQLNDVVARVANVNAAGNTLELEGIDSTLFNTFTSGSFQVVTLGTTISHLVDINASGGEPEFADTTTIHQQVRTRTPTVTSPLSYSMTGLWDPQDAGFRRCRPPAGRWPSGSGSSPSPAGR